MKILPKYLPYIVIAITLAVAGSASAYELLGKKGAASVQPPALTMSPKTILSTSSPAVITPSPSAIPSTAAAYTPIPTLISKSTPSTLTGTLTGNNFSLHGNNGQYYSGSVSGMTVFLYGPSGVSISGTYSNSSTISASSGASTCSGKVIYTTVSLSCSDGNSLSGSIIGNQFFLNDLHGGNYSGSFIGSQVFIYDYGHTYFGQEIQAQYFTGTYSASGTLSLSGGGVSYTGTVTNGAVNLNKN